jgi:hypothetical protein
MTKQITKLGAKYGWQLIDHQENIKMLSFYKLVGGSPARLNVYYSKMTVGTSINHPTKGKTQLFRKHVTMAELEKLFIRPRLHTQKGYYKRA